METFEAAIRSSGSGRGGALVAVPPEVVEALGGGGRIPVNEILSRLDELEAGQA